MTFKGRLTLKILERVSVADIVVANIKEMILSGQFSVGDKLPTEYDLCDKFNVSRTSVREAFRALQAMGLIKMLRGRGAFVAKTKEDEPENIIRWFSEHEVKLQDYFEVRLSFEPLAVKLAIKRATDEEIKELEELYVAFKKALDDFDAAKMAIIDEAFHNTIISLTHNKLLISINKNLSAVFSEYRNKSFTIKEYAKDALDPHKKILEAIKSRDIEAGMSEMVKHINISMEDVSKVAKMHT